jgi:hypothetical protein
MKKAADFGLKAGVSESSATVAAAINKQLVGMSKFTDTPEGTKQQFQFIACIDRRMAQAIAEEAQAASAAAAAAASGGCSVSSPCVDIVRVADFSGSSCAGLSSGASAPTSGAVPSSAAAAVSEAAVSASGPAPKAAHTDVAVFEDNIAVTPASVSTYRATAQPNGKVTVVLKRLDAGQEIVVPPVSKEECPDCSYNTLNFNMPVVDGKVRYWWHWTDGHSASKGEGLAFKSLYRVKSIFAQVILPKDVQLENSRALPASLASKCVFGFQNMACRDLTGEEGREIVRWAWDWNLWARCPVK